TYISNNDVYFAGYGRDNKATVWKNGAVLYDLSFPDEYESAASSVVAIDGDVYVLSWTSIEVPSEGWPPMGSTTKYTLCTWKNGELLYSYEIGGGGSHTLFVK
ncbi:MAG: hypothetical protein LBN95_01050, partial [Prevotellaceae bacterium]|nr:hypothetical protein [Prevotellaceae bacterium]